MSEFFKFKNKLQMTKSLDERNDYQIILESDIKKWINYFYIYIFSVFKKDPFKKES